MSDEPCCFTCQHPGSWLGGHCIYCRWSRLGIEQFAALLAAALEDREREAIDRGFGDSTRLLRSMRALLVNRKVSR